MTIAAEQRSGTAWLNAAGRGEAEDALLRCCSSRQFAAEMAAALPYTSVHDALQLSRRVWWNQVSVQGWLQAFEGHPRIGDVDGLRKKFATTAELCEGEQSKALASANESTLQALAEWNKRYEQRFGHIFIICATGKPAGKVLEALKERYPNRPADELFVAAAEQQKITELRLKKMLTQSEDSEAVPASTQQASKPTSNGIVPAPTASVEASQVSVQQAAADYRPWHRLAGRPDTLRPPITTHVLDVALGRPAANIPVILDLLVKPAPLGPGQDSTSNLEWSRVGYSETDSDGRSGPLMAPAVSLDEGTYRLTFVTDSYFSRLHGGASFYPHVTVVFEVKAHQKREHFHVPVLVSPYSYSTYRGS